MFTNRIRDLLSEVRTRLISYKNQNILLLSRLIKKKYAESQALPFSIVDILEMLGFEVLFSPKSPTNMHLFKDFNYSLNIAKLDAQ